MKLKVIVGFVAIIAAFVLDYLPMETAILVYGVIGATLGAFFRKVNNWAREGLVSVIGGVIVAILIYQVLPPLIETAVQQSSGVEAIILKLIPFTLKAGIIWGAVVSLLNKLARISR